MKSKGEGMRIGKTDIVIVWILLLLLLYPTVTRGLSGIDLDPQFNQTDGMGPGMQEQVGVTSEANFVLRRNTFFGYRTVRDGESMYLYGLYVLPDEVLGYNFRELWIHHIVIYGLIACLVVLLLKRFMLFSEEVNITWK